MTSKFISYGIIAFIIMYGILGFKYFRLKTSYEELKQTNTQLLQELKISEKNNKELGFLLKENESRCQIMIDAIEANLTTERNLCQQKLEEANERCELLSQSMQVPVSEKKEVVLDDTSNRAFRKAINAIFDRWNLKPQK